MGEISLTSSPAAAASQTAIPAADTGNPTLYANLSVGVVGIETSAASDTSQTSLPSAFLDMFCLSRPVTCVLFTELIGCTGGKGDDPDGDYLTAEDGDCLEEPTTDVFGNEIDPAQVYPDAPEICNGFDDDCDSNVDFHDLNGDGIVGPDDEEFLFTEGVYTLCGDSDQDSVGSMTDYDGDGSEFGDRCVRACQDAATVNALLDAGGTGYQIDTSYNLIIDEGFRYVDLGPDYYDDYENGDLDCDDDDAQNFPDNTEICDEQDNNCDNAVDEDDSNIQFNQYYYDSDGDGYPNSGYPYFASCEPPESLAYVTDPTLPQDCDNDNPDINPGATEICGDGQDNDCNSATSDICE